VHKPSDLPEARAALETIQDRASSLPPASVTRSSEISEIQDDTRTAVQLNITLESLLVEASDLVGDCGRVIRRRLRR